MDEPAVQTVPIIKRYQRLIEISRDLASTFELNELLNRIVYAAADLTHAEAASILLYEQNKNQLYFQASTNLDTPLMHGLSVPVDNSLAGWIVTEQKPVVVSDAQRDPRFFKHTEKETDFHTNSLLGVPMLAKNKVIGVLEALNKIDGEFTEDDQEILMTLGAQAATAIENARLFMQSDLIAEMVHELRTPLGSINAASHLLLHPEVPEEKRNNMVMIIQAETKRLSELTTAFLDLSRLESGRTKFRVGDIDMVILLGECTGIMRSQMLEREIKFVWRVPEELPKIQGDRDKVKQVILNLLSNATKYNSEGGQITLKAEVKDKNIIVSVTDTGPGIPKESLKHLFQKFYRVPGTEKMATGTGLGLSISQKIIHAHGGEITIQSKVGVGTTFSIHLTVVDK